MNETRSLATLESSYWSQRTHDRYVRKADEGGQSPYYGKLRGGYGGPWRRHRDNALGRSARSSSMLLLVAKQAGLTLFCQEVLMIPMRRLI